MITRIVILLAALAASHLCRPVQGAETRPAAPPRTTNTMDHLDDRQVLGPGDRVTYRVIEDQDEPRSLTVTDSGHLEVPYYGLVQAAGKTSLELAREVKGRLEKDLYHQATVILAVELVNRARVTGKVYVTGQVRQPGGYEIPAGDNMTVSKAVLSAGGFSDFSDRKKVRLIRRTAGGEMTFVVNVHEIWKQGSLDKDLKVQPDDLIVVPESLFKY